MRPVVIRFTGPRIAYLGISDSDLNMPLKRAVAAWYEAMATIKTAGFTHVGIDASADSPHLGAFSDAVYSNDMNLLVEGSPRIGYVEDYRGIIQTTEQYAYPPEGHIKLGEQPGLPFIVTRHSTSYDPDIQAQWESTEPKMQAMVYEMFVRQIVAEGGIPALPPFGWAEAMK